MIAHVVLLKLRATMSAENREALLESMRVAFTGIPEIKRVRIGKRILPPHNPIRAAAHFTGIGLDSVNMFLCRFNKRF